MTPEQWDAHKRNVCDGCRFNSLGRCPVMAIMQEDPNDNACSVFFRQGTCNQYQQNRQARKGQ